mmetsp:Transcript_2598/g.3735  ORF Transcript_2598/g.3735 Transcript_2598/m.3735 type:complete len:749 (-) Transcript_2598:31-2277(-)
MFAKEEEAKESQHDEHVMNELPPAPAENGSDEEFCLVDSAEAMSDQGSGDPKGELAKDESEDKQLDVLEALQAAPQQENNEEESEVESNVSAFGAQSTSTSKILPGTSEFFCNEEASSVVDDGSEWDSVSKSGSEKRDVGVVLEQAGKVFLDAMKHFGDESNGRETILEQGARLLATLEHALGSQRVEKDEKVDKGTDEKVDEETDEKADEKSECDTEEPKFHDAWSRILNVLQHRHVVQALQEFLNHQLVTEFVVQIANEGRASIESFQRAVMKFIGDLLTELGELVKRAPELISLMPITFSYFSQFLQEKKEAESPCQAPAHPEQVPVQTQGPIHTHILCDGCDSKKKKDISRLAGHTNGNYIQGVRWKSAIIQDFDICSTCEESGDYEKDYGPFLKITHPRKAPKEIVVILKDDRQRRCRRTTNRRGCVRPAAPQRTRVERSSFCCPQGHQLNTVKAHQHLECDICGKGTQSIDGKEEWHGCRGCNWDACSACVGEEVPKEQEVVAASPVVAAPPPMVAAPPCADAPPAVVAPPAAAQEVARPQAKFVADLSLPDGSLVDANNHVLKTWRISNSGRQDWPEGVRLVCVGGERMSGPLNGLEVPPLPLSAELDLSLGLVAPERPGRYVGYWRLMTGNQERFGHRLWVDITVKEPVTPTLPIAPPLPTFLAPPAAQPPVIQYPNIDQVLGNEVEAPQAVPTETPHYEKWAEQLQNLSDMGFHDFDKNVSILEEENGNMENVIPRLIE